jgi:vacuolar-type H+-ATPase subunit B/Vma2
MRLTPLDIPLVENGGKSLAIFLEEKLEASGRSHMWIVAQFDERAKVAKSLSQFVRVIGSIGIDCSISKD